MTSQHSFKRFLRLDVLQLFALVRARFVEVRVAQVAGALTFTSLLSLIPLLTVVIAVTSQFKQFSAMTGALRIFLIENLLPDRAGKVIATYALQFSQKASNLTIVGTLMLLVTSMMLLVTVERTLNTIWTVRQTRSWRIRVPAYWLALTLGPLVLAASIAATMHLIGASLGAVDDPAWLRTLLYRLAPAALMVGFFTYVFHSVPNRRLVWWHSLIGGAIAGLGVVLIQRLLGFYLAHLPSFTLIYGTFSVLPIFLLWMYLSWSAILLGAIVAAVVPDFLEHRGLLPDTPMGRVHAALRMVVFFSEAQQTGASLALEQIARRSGLSYGRAELMLEDMRQAGWVLRAEDGYWALCISAHTLKLGDVISQVAMGAAPDYGRTRASEEDKSLIEAALKHVRQSLDVPVLTLVASGESARLLAAPEKALKA